MKNVREILAKKYHKSLRKVTSYKARLFEMQKLFKEYGIACVMKDEFSFFQIEIIYESILNKQRFEDTYLTTYVTMHDFWEDLDYQERKHQMNVDIDRMRKELKSFPFNNEEIYMPMFDERMNRLYTQEIVLLELKQYGRFQRKFDDVIQKDLYGINPYMYNFTSCLFICGDEKHFSIYNPDLNRLYFIEDFVCTSQLSFDPSKSGDTDFETMKHIAQLYMRQEEQELAKLLIDSNLINEHIKKKLNKYIQKMISKEK